MEPRTITPAVQPDTCQCMTTYPRIEQGEDRVFRCKDCGGYLGYCGPNGCDAHVQHTHWREHGNA